MNKIFLSYFLLLLTTCHAMERDEEVLPILGKDFREFNDVQKTDDKKTTEECILDDQDSLKVINSENNFYPPLELWERFLASQDSLFVSSLIDQIELCRKNYLLNDRFSKKAFNALINFHLKDYFCGDCSFLTCNYRCGKHPSDLLAFLDFGTQFSTYAKNIEGAVNDFLSVESIRSIACLNTCNIDVNFSQKLEKRLATPPLVLPLLRQSLWQIFTDKEHPKYMQVYMLFYIGDLLHVSYIIEDSAFRKKAAVIQNHQARIHKMLSAGFKLCLNSWAVGFPESDIPPVDYYFLNTNNDESAEWEEVYEQCCPLSFDSSFQTNKLRVVLDNYHQNKNRYDIDAMSNALENIVRYIDSFDVTYQLSVIGELEKDRDKWCGYCRSLEAVERDNLVRENFKLNIASVFGDDLVFVLGKLNIDLDSFDDVDGMHSQILSFCEVEYNNKNCKLKLADDKKDLKEIDNLRSRCINKLASLKAIHVSRAKAEKFIENYRSELLPLLPLIANALTFLDPLKRCYLHEYLPEWKSLSKENSNNVPDFLLWLEGENIPCYKSNESKIESSFSADKALVKFIDYVAYNSFFTGGSIPLEGVFIYVVSPDRSLYVAPDKNDSVLIKEFLCTYQCDHSDISIEPWAISAGQMFFKGGKIIYINRQSGHYKPGIKHLKYGVKSLKQKFGHSIFCEECLIDPSLSTHVEFNQQENLLNFSRFLCFPLLNRSDELAKNDISLFELGFID